MPADLRLLDTEQRALVELVRELAEAEIAPKVAGYEERGEEPTELYGKLAELGLTGIPFPEEHGGGGQPYLTYLLVVEELAAAHLSLAIGLSVHTLCAFAIDTFGTDSQKKEMLSNLTTGEWWGAYSLSEPGSGSDAAALISKAARSDGGYRLNGSKVFCTRGNEADLVLVMARTSDEGARGVSAFLVRNGTRGFMGTKKEDKMGWRSSPTWQLVLDDAQVPVGARLGDEGEGFKIALASLDSGRLGIAACATGLAQAALDVAAEYATQRRQFGRSIGEFQGLQFLLADMAAAVESSRATYLHAARLRDAGRRFSRQASIAKLVCTDAAMRVTTDAVQVLGGYGCIPESPV